MPGFNGSLVTAFRTSRRNNAEELFDTYVELLRTHPDTPRDTGRLAAGIERGKLIENRGLYAATIESTARSDDGADYGRILDRADGKTITPVRKKALANTRTGWGPYASAKQSTKHVGWWAKVNKPYTWRRALAATFDNR